MLNKCATDSNKSPSEFVLPIFCDLSKAFDVLNHEILLSKLYTLGIRGPAFQWFSSYLDNRKQYVEIGNFQSPMSDISLGIPQGSILGPLLFLIYVNDIQNSCNEMILSFADDTTLVVSSEKLDTLFLLANNAINELNTWLLANRLKLNARKTTYMVIRKSNRILNLNELELKIGDEAIARTDGDSEGQNFLGLWIDDRLSWKKTY